MAIKSMTFAITGGLFSRTKYKTAVNIMIDPKYSKAVVIVDASGDTLGYVSKDSYNFQDKINTEVYDFLETYKDFDVTFEFLDDGKTANNSVWLRCKATFNIKEEVLNMNISDKYLFQVTGDNSGKRFSSSARTTTLSKLQKGETVPVSLTIESVNGVDEIVVFAGSDLIAKVNENQSNGYSDFHDILVYVKKDANARREGVAIRKEGLNIVVEMLVKDSEVVLDNDSIKTEIKRIVSEGIMTEVEIQKRVDYALGNSISANNILDILKTYMVYPDNVKMKIAIPKTLYVDTSNKILEAVFYINSGLNLMLEGDRGVGKNVFTETISWLYNRPLYEFSMNSQHDNTSYLGGKVFDDGLNNNNSEDMELFENISSLLNRGGLKNWFTGKKTDAGLVMTVIKNIAHYFSGKQKLMFEPSTIIQSAMYGGIIVMDEVNTGIGHTMSVFNSLFDERRRITVEGFKTIEAHKNFLAISTMNKDYQATFDLNEAFDDRFERIVFPSNNSIAGILRAKVPGVSPKTVEVCDSIYKQLLNSVQDGVLDSKVLTIRGFINVARVVEKGMSLKRALEISVANKATELEDRETIMEYIDKRVI